MEVIRVYDVFKSTKLDEITKQVQIRGPKMEPREPPTFGDGWSEEVPTKYSKKFHLHRFYFNSSYLPLPHRVYIQQFLCLGLLNSVPVPHHQLHSDTCLNMPLMAALVSPFATIYRLTAPCPDRCPPPGGSQSSTNMSFMALIQL